MMATARTIMDAECWEAFCNLTGMNPWAVNEGMDPQTQLHIPDCLEGTILTHMTESTERRMTVLETENAALRERLAELELTARGD